MNDTKISVEATTLHIRTKYPDAIYHELNEAQDGGLLLDVRASRSWFATTITAQLADDALTADPAVDIERIARLARSIEVARLPRAA